MKITSAIHSLPYLKKIGTLFLAIGAAVVLHAQTTESHSSASRPIFNGKDLNNWTGDPRYWRVENGTLVGEVKPGQELQHNSFLVWKGTMPKDFELWVDFRISPEGNSGINYRSQPVEGVAHALRGYQADIDGADQFTGQVYEERGRTTLAYRWESSRILSFPDTAKLANYTRNNNWQNRKVERSLQSADQDRSRTQPGQWSRLHITVKGNNIKHYVNDVLVSEVVDEDRKNSTTSGQFGVQVHVGPPMKVEFRNFVVKEPALL